MISCFEKTGAAGIEELKSAPGFPSEGRMNEGRVAVIECLQCIPCNPCEASCRFGAITIGRDITALPVLDEKKCTGCGACIVKCPGLAITVVNKAYSEKEASIDFPFEYYPLPSKGDIVSAVDRSGNTVCSAKVLRVISSSGNDGTSVLSISVPKEMADTVRSIIRLPREV